MSHNGFNMLIALAQIIAFQDALWPTAFLYTFVVRACIHAYMYNKSVIVLTAYSLCLHSTYVYVYVCITKYA